MSKSASGFTLLEMLIVTGILSILMAMGVTHLRPPSAYLFTNDLKAMVQQARYEAIKRNTPVAVVWDEQAQMFTTRWNSSAPALSKACSGTEVLMTKSLKDYRPVSVASAFSQSGVVWQPSGLGVNCSGGVMSDATTLTDGKATYKLLVSAAGQIRIEEQ